jgi:hypothetical protein
VLKIDAELAEFHDRRSPPPDGVGRERQRERHPVRFAERLTIAQYAVVPGRRFDREALCLEPSDELANVLPHSCLIVGGANEPGRRQAALPAKPKGEYDATEVERLPSPRALR